MPQHAQRTRPARRRQGPQLQGFVIALLEAAHALQHELLVLGVKGDEHRGGGLVIGQHGHILDLGCGLQLLLQRRYLGAGGSL